MTEAASRTRIANILWQRRLSHALGPNALPLGNGLLTLSHVQKKASLRALHVHDGSEQWGLSFDTERIQSLFRTGRFVSCVGSKSLTVVDCTSRKVVRKKLAGKGRTYTGTGLAKKGFVVLVSETASGTLLEAYNAQSGGVAWETELSPGSSSSVHLAEAGGRLICLTQDKGTIRLVARDLESGRECWQRSDIEGNLVGQWAAFNLLDVIVEKSGVWGIHAQDGQDRSLRFYGIEYQEALIVGQSFLTVSLVDNLIELSSFDTVSSELKGKVLMDVVRILDAHASEVLVEHTNGYPVLYALPNLESVEFKGCEGLGRIHHVAWARDALYLMSEDCRTITAVDLRQV